MHFEGCDDAKHRHLSLHVLRALPSYWSRTICVGPSAYAGALISRLEYERFCTVWNKIDKRVRDLSPQMDYLRHQNLILIICPRVSQGLLFVDMKKVQHLMRRSKFYLIRLVHLQHFG